MASHSPRLMFVGLVSLLALGGCAYDDGYGYGGMSAGTGYYAGDYYGPSEYGNPGYYGGWYNDYYYPGSGYYVFDRGGRRHRWDDGQRSYWEARRQQYRGQQYRDRGQDRRPHDDHDGRYPRGRDSNRDGGYDRRPDSRPEAQPGRGVEGQRNWRQESRPETRPDRPAYRNEERGSRSDEAGRAAPPRPAPQVQQAPQRGQGRDHRNQMQQQ